MGYRLTRAAEEQIDTILLASARAHGLEAAARYSLLIRTATAALGVNPRPPGAVDVPRLPGIKAYPIRLSRSRIEPTRRVHMPRHIIIYRLASDDVVEILGLAHDRMVLSRAARKALRGSP